MVPYFDPVPIEVAPGFRLTRGFHVANVLGLTKGKAIGVRTLVVLSPLVPLSNGPQIDHFSHSVAPRWYRITSQCGAQLKAKHCYQMCRHVGGKVPLRRTPQDRFETAWPIRAVVQYT